MVEQMQCSVAIEKQLTESVWQITVNLPKQTDFKAGQYLQVVMGDKDKRPFSIASCPSETQGWSLHIGATPDNSYAMEVLEQIRAQGSLTIVAPLGDAYYRASSDRTKILIAGGTGFSYTYSILQHLLREHPKQPVVLYWGARRKEDLYLHETLEQLAQQHQQFDYRPVLEEANGAWQYDIGLVHHAVMGRHQDLAQYDVYVAGRFEMVRVIRDDFVARGLPLQQLYGDALAFI